jgi:hypothetical protein
MYRSLRLAVALAAALLISSSVAIAAPNDSSDGPRDPLTRLVRVIKHLLHIVPLEDPLPPKP